MQVPLHAPARFPLANTLANIRSVVPLSISVTGEHSTLESGACESKVSAGGGVHDAGGVEANPG